MFQQSDDFVTAVNIEVVTKVFFKLHYRVMTQEFKTTLSDPNQGLELGTTMGNLASLVKLQSARSTAF